MGRIDPLTKWGRVGDPGVMSTRDARFFAAFLVIMLFGAARQADARGSDREQATSAMVCEIKREAASGGGHARLVSITTHAYHEYHGGFFLSELDCVDPLDGTGILEIHLPAGQVWSDFPELMNLYSEEWLSRAKGMRTYCTCVGKLTFRGRNPVFTVHRARVWASRH